MKEHGHEQRHHGFAGALERRRARGGQTLIFRIEEQGRRDLVASVRKAQDPDKSLLDYRKEDFDLGAAMPVIAAAMKETKHGRGVAVVRGLPRDELDEKSFELMTGDRFAHGRRPPARESDALRLCRAGRGHRLSHRNRSRLLVECGARLPHRLERCRLP